MENNTNYQINLDIFQGPLDLLLHLIEQNEIDIYNIPIALITEKYLDYLHTIQLLNLEGVGDFLVMAATLMQIKAKMLLPQLQSETDEVLDEEEDPRWELAQKLIEYKKIKGAALSLQELEVQQLKVYPRSGGEFLDQQIIAPENPIKQLSVWDLLDAFRVILESLEELRFDSLPREEVSVKQRMTEIIDLLNNQGALSFYQVFKDIKTKMGLITCLLAVLELIRLHRISVTQEESFGEIILALPKKVINPA